MVSLAPARTSCHRLVTPRRSPPGSSIVPSRRASSSARSWATTRLRASADGSAAGAPAEGRLSRPRFFSRTTSSARLSSRSPRYTGWRSLLSSVHSVKRTCATRSGRTQCAGSFDLDRVRERRSFDFARPSAASRRARAPSGRTRCRCGRRRSAPRGRFSSCTPSSSAPKYWRVCRGSVQPPTTNSCCCRSFSLRQAGLRRPE